MFVKRSLWAPDNLADLRAWYKADAITGLSDGDPVSTWADSSGGGYDLTQTSTARPLYQTSTLNGLPVIEFDGTDDTLDASTAADWKFLNDSTGSTVVAVWQPGTSADPNASYPLMGTNAGTAANIGVSFQYDNRSIISGSDNAVGAAVSNGTADAQSRQVAWYFTPGGSNTVFSDFNNLAVAGTANMNAWVLDPGNATAANRLKVNRNGGTLSGNQTFTKTPSTGNPAFPLSLGSLGNGVTPTLGYIAEVVICDAVLSSTDREKVEGYLAWKWGLESNLPSGHPYENAAPTV
jgi:hypothetical protein